MESQSDQKEYPEEQKPRPGVLTYVVIFIVVVVVVLLILALLPGPQFGVFSNIVHNI